VSQSVYLRPVRIEDALRALAARPLNVLAGGTDFYPARVGRLVREDILDITALAPLRGVTQTEEGWRIGALTTWTELINTPLPSVFHGIKLAAREVGGFQIQNAATVIGNLCNASPAADGIPPLMALSAEVELSSINARRRIALTDFVTGNRCTARQADELVTAVLVPHHGSRARSTFLKLGTRRYLVISIAMVAVTLDVSPDGTIVSARVVIGACAPVARHIPALEARLLGRSLSRDLADLATPSDLLVLTPISDVRGSSQYRLDAALTLIRRALQGIGDE
jgi:CO/xanthine dehydrogenase FAD-binding subunit